MRQNRNCGANPNKYEFAVYVKKSKYGKFFFTPAGGHYNEKDVVMAATKLHRQLTRNGTITKDGQTLVLYQKTYGYQAGVVFPSLPANFAVKRHEFIAHFANSASVSTKVLLDARLKKLLGSLPVPK